MVDDRDRPPKLRGHPLFACAGVALVSLHVVNQRKEVRYAFKQEWNGGTILEVGRVHLRL
jgi:hypothetical protein